MELSDELKSKIFCSSLIQSLGVACNKSQFIINTGVIIVQKYLASSSCIDYCTASLGGLYLSCHYHDSPLNPVEIIENFIKINQVTMNKEEKYSLSLDMCDVQQQMQDIIGMPLFIKSPVDYLVKLCKIYDMGEKFQQSVTMICGDVLQCTDFAVRYTSCDIAAIAFNVMLKKCFISLAQLNNRPWYHFISSQLTLDFINNKTREFVNIFSMLNTKSKLYAFKLKKTGNKRTSLFSDDEEGEEAVKPKHMKFTQPDSRSLPPPSAATSHGTVVKRSVKPKCRKSKI